MAKFRMNEEDGALLRAMRNQAIYSGYKNPIIEWTMSPAWTNPDKEPWNYGPKLVRIRFSHTCASVAPEGVMVGQFEVKNLDK